MPNLNGTHPGSPLSSPHRHSTLSHKMEKPHTSPPSTRLIIRRISPILTETKRLLATHCSISLQVRLVAYYNDRHVLVVFYADDLFAQFGELVEGTAGRDGEDEEKALAGFHVEFSVGEVLVGVTGLRYNVSRRGVPMKNADEMDGNGK